MTRMPRILIITTSFAFEDSGREAAGVFVRDFATTLSTRSDVAVVAPKLASDSRRPSPPSPYRCYPFSVPRLPLSLLKPAQPGHWPAIGSSLRRGDQATANACREFQPDLILALWVLPCGLWAKRAAQRHRIPYATWALGSDIWSLGRIPIVRGILRKVLRGAAISFADGYELAEDVSAISDKSCEFLPSSRLLSRKENVASAPTGKCKFAFLGRWHPNKGIDLFLTALRNAPPEFWHNVDEVRIAGGGPLGDDVNNSVSALIDNGHPVSMSGFLSSDEAASLIAWADYLVVPSRIESIPVVFSDAMQVGTPIIATPVGDLPTLLTNNEVGFLCKDVSANAILDGLMLAIDADTARFANGISIAKNQFSLENSANKVIELL